MPSISKARFDALCAIEQHYDAEGAQVSAAHAADLLRIEELRAQLVASEVARTACESQLRTTLEAPSAPSEVEVVADKRTLMAVAKKLSANGLRVSMRGTALFDIATGKLIAQVRS